LAERRRVEYANKRDTRREREEEEEEEKRENEGDGRSWTKRRSTNLQWLLPFRFVAVGASLVVCRAAMP
jgi:hypothetical protein